MYLKTPVESCRPPNQNRKLSNSMTAGPGPGPTPSKEAGGVSRGAERASDFRASGFEMRGVGRLLQSKIWDHEKILVGTHSMHAPD